GFTPPEYILWHHDSRILNYGGGAGGVVVERRPLQPSYAPSRLVLPNAAPTTPESTPAPPPTPPPPPSPSSSVEVTRQPQSSVWGVAFGECPASTLPPPVSSSSCWPAAGGASSRDHPAPPLSLDPIK
ncbi:hypothetical protein Pmani_005569, partial [Petrolisthes manimaculis]